MENEYTVKLVFRGIYDYTIVAIEDEDENLYYGVRDEDNNLLIDNLDSVDDAIKFIDDNYKAKNSGEDLTDISDDEYIKLYENTLKYKDELEDFASNYNLLVDVFDFVSGDNKGVVVYTPLKNEENLVNLNKFFNEIKDKFPSLEKYNKIDDYTYGIIIR